MKEEYPPLSDAAKIAIRAAADEYWNGIREKVSRWPFLKDSYPNTGPSNEGGRLSMVFMSVDDCRYAYEESSSRKDRDWIKTVAREIISTEVRNAGSLPPAVLDKLQEQWPGKRRAGARKA